MNEMQIFELLFFIFIIYVVISQQQREMKKT
jgi:hypothetical protein